MEVATTDQRVEGHMRIMWPGQGDDHITWKPMDPKDVEKARKKFDKALKKGHQAFKIVKETVHRRGEQVTEFDPSYTEGYLLVPAMSGG